MTQTLRICPAGLTHFRQAAAKKRRACLLTQISDLRSAKAAFENSDPFIGLASNISIRATAERAVKECWSEDTLLFKSRIPVAAN
jgi:hypothetical protein